MSEIKSITLGGLDNQASPYAAEDGALALSVGCVKKEAGLEAVPGGDVVMRFPKTLRLMHIHRWGERVHYIFTHGAELYDGERLIHDLGEDGDTILQVTSVRGTLVVSTGTGLRYARYTEGGYQWLGALPEMPYVRPYIDVDLLTYSDIVRQYPGKQILNTQESAALTNIYEELTSPAANVDIKRTIHLSGSVQEEVWNKAFELLGLLRKCAHRLGTFTAPFYTRFALRLYDGRYINVSRPYPLCPTTSYNPYICITKAEKNKDNTTLTFDLQMPSARLMYEVGQISPLWDDIVTGIDFFISREVVGYTETTEAALSIETRGNENEKAQDVCIPKYFTGEGLMCESFAGRWVDKSCKMKLLKVFNSEDEQYEYTYKLPEGTYIIVAVQSDKFDHCYAFGQPYIHPNGNKYSDYVDAPKLSGEALGLFYAEFGEGMRNYEIFSLNSYAFSVQPKGKAEIRYYLYDKTGEATSVQLNPKATINLTRTDGNKASDVFERINDDGAIFYKVHSIDFKEIDSITFTTPNFVEKEIDNLMALPRLEDITMRPAAFRPSDLFTYNQRLHIALEEQELEACDPTEQYLYGTESDTNLVPLAVEVTDDGQKYTRLILPRETGIASPDGECNYFFYPNSNATALIMGYTSTREQDSLYIENFPLAYRCQVVKAYTCRIPLKRHETIQGAYAFNDFQPLATNAVTTTGRYLEYLIPPAGSPEDDVAFLIGEYRRMAADIGLTEELDTTPGIHRAGITSALGLTSARSTIPCANKILQSAADNPFALLNAGTSLLPCSRILKIAAATKPLSQGQFGQYPLYAFTSDGIFALAVGQDGTLGAASAVSQDVLLSPDSLTQLDQSILFATRRGLMEISGSQVESVSQKLRGHDDTADMRYYATGGSDNGEPLLPLLCSLAGLPENLTPAPHFEHYLQGARIRYDYARRLIYVYHPLHPLAYVLTLDGGAWGMIESRMRYNAPSYTSALVVEEIDKDTHALVDRSATADDEGESVPFLLLTRPLNLGRASQKKTIEQLMTRGNYPEGSVRVLLLASDDLRRWAITHKSADDRIEGLSGTPYKWYRAALYGHLQERDALHGLDIDLTPRLNNKLR